MAESGGLVPGTGSDTERQAHAAIERALSLSGIADGLRLRLLAAGFDDAMAVGLLAAAELHAREQVDIARRLAEQLATPEAQRDLSVSLDNLGRVAGALDRVSRLLGPPRPGGQPPSRPTDGPG